MAVPFGFSAGDCLAVCILIKDAIKALDEVSGASSEYQEVKRELWALDAALLEAELCSRSHELQATVEMKALGETARRTTEQCRACLEGFLARIKHYDALLGDQPAAASSASRWSAAKAKAKITWALARKNDLARFRTQVNGLSSTINMLLITAGVSLSKFHDTRLHERVNDMQLAIESSVQQQDILLELLKTSVDKNTGYLEAQSSMASRLADGMQYFITLGSELRDFMARILMNGIRSYNILLELQTRVPREFGPCWIQEPLMFTDALGRVTPIHLELVNTWEVFEAVLTARFIDIPGEGKIRNKEYAIRDQSLQRDIERSLPFHAAFLPGRYIDMCVIFKQDHQEGMTCPGCRREVEEKDHSKTVSCQSCGMWFQRVEEIIEDSLLAPIPQGDEPASRHYGPGHSRNDERISFFKRVRLFQQKHVSLQPQIHDPTPARHKNIPSTLDIESDWEVRFCLSCEKQITNGLYCSESCRLADFEGIQAGKTAFFPSAPSSTGPIRTASYLQPSRSEYKSLPMMNIHYTPRLSAKYTVSKAQSWTQNTRTPVRYKSRTAGKPRSSA